MDDSKNIPTKLAWEKRYNDDSGVEFAVRYDSTQSNYNDGGPVIEFEAIDTIKFPLSELDWLILCLQRIKSETAPLDHPRT